MEYQTQEKGEFTILSLRGEVDMHYTPEVRKHILDLLHQKRNLMIDLSEVGYIDSSGVACLVEGFQYARKHSLKFGLLGVSDAVMQVLQLARLDKVFPIHASLDAAD